MKTKQINMKLTRENTALDLSKLTEGELKEVTEKLKLTNKDNLRFLMIHYNNYVIHQCLTYGWKLIDFTAFKSIHFPEQEDKPTYEELVEALRDCFYFIEELNNHGITNWSENSKVKQLLERIK